MANRFFHPGRLHVISICIVIIFSVACRKKHELPPNHNEIKAKVLFTSGNEIHITGKESKAWMGWDWVGFTSLGVRDDVNGRLSLTSFTRVKTPATYANFSVQFEPAPGKGLPTYRNWQLVNGHLVTEGSVTFTTVNDHTMEGTFHAVCWANKDTVVITGMFKGDFLN